MELKKIKYLIAILALALIFLGAGCEEEKTGQFDYQRIELANGMEVITLEDFSCPIVAVQVWYHVGSKDEDPQRQGFAHMFEHMMFRGTDKLGPTDHFPISKVLGEQRTGIPVSTSLRIRIPEI